MSLNKEEEVVCDRCNEVDEKATRQDKHKPKHICRKCMDEILSLRVKRFKENENRGPKEKLRAPDGISKGKGSRGYTGQNFRAKGTTRKVI